MRTDPGTVSFFDAATNAALGQVTVGALPDMVTFTRSGDFALVANEGEPEGYCAGDVDPEGSVSVVDLRAGAAAASVRTAGFAAFDADALRAGGVRVYGPGASAAQDLEPEYITTSTERSDGLGVAPGGERHRDRRRAVRHGHRGHGTGHEGPRARRERARPVRPRRRHPPRHLAGAGPVPARCRRGLRGQGQGLRRHRERGRHPGLRLLRRGGPGELTDPRPVGLPERRGPQGQSRPRPAHRDDDLALGGGWLHRPAGAGCALDLGARQRWRAGLGLR